MSRKARVRSLSKSLKDGMSPMKVLVNACSFSKIQSHALDYFAENTSCSHDWFCTFVDMHRRRETK